MKAAKIAKNEWMAASCSDSIIREGLPAMNVSDHLRTTGGALKNWAIAQLQDSLAVGTLWWIGLRLLHVPLAPSQDLSVPSSNCSHVAL